MNAYTLFLRLPAGVDQIRESTLIPGPIAKLIYQHVPLANMVRREIGRQPCVIVEPIALTDTDSGPTSKHHRATTRTND